MLIKNGTIYDGMGGKPFEGDILIKDGKIEKVHENISCDEEVIDASGCCVLPGFIDAMNYYGCQGPGWTDDDTLESENALSPQMSVYYAFDYGNMNFRQLYHYGTTAAGIIPSTKNVISGKGSVFHTYALTNNEGLIKKDTVMIGSATKISKRSNETYPMTSMGVFSVLYESLKEAELYDKKEEKKYSKIQELLPVIKGEMPLILYVESFTEMERVIHLMKSFPNIKYSFAGCYGYKKELIKEVPDDTVFLLGDRTFFMNDSIRKTNYKDLTLGNLNLAIGNVGEYTTSGKESLLWNAQLMYKHGYNIEKVISAMTSTPAKMLCVDDMVGAIKEGLIADITIWDKNPISRHDAILKNVLINGKNVLHKERGTLCW